MRLLVWLPNLLASKMPCQKALEKNEFFPIQLILYFTYLYKNSVIFFFLPRKAVGEIIPVLLATIMAIPVSKNGTVKSTTASLSELIISDVITMSVFLFTKSATKPFHFPF